MSGQICQSSGQLASSKIRDRLKMRDKLKLQFPWKILKDLKPNSTSNYKCQSSSDDELHFKVSREADCICFDLSGTLPKDLQIELTKFGKMSNEDEGPDLTRGVQFQFNPRPSSKEHDVTIHRMVSNTGRSLKRKRTKKMDADFVSPESILEMDEQVMTSLSIESLMSNYAIVSDSDGSKTYSCKICSEDLGSLRKFYCHMQKHGDLRPWACPDCDFTTSFKSLLVSHAASEHGPGAGKKARTTQCLKVGFDIATDTDLAARAKMPLKKGKKKKGLKNSKPTLICATPLVQKIHDKPRTSETETVVVGDTDEDGSKTIAVEIEVHEEAPEEPVPKSAKKAAMRSGLLTTEPPADGSGTISVVGAVVEEDSAVVANISGVAVIQTPKLVHVQGPPDLDPRLRKVAKNYQFVIDEYCMLDSEGFLCKLCRETFRKREHFMRHLHKEHQECKPYYCLICDFRTRSKPNVFTHNSFKHTTYNSRRFTCAECGVACMNKSRYEIHMQTHSSEKKFKCELCGERFITKSRRQEHIKRVHEGRAFACTVCDTRFSTQYALKTHSNVHEPGKRWKCMYCQKMYRSEQSLKIHMHSHTTVFHCQICDKDIYSYSAFIGHKNLHDPKSKKHRCDVCNKLFPTGKIRDRHVVTRHSESTFDHKCLVCFKGFKLLEQLTSHMICHSGDKPWACEVCGLTFKRQSSLSTHRNKHKQQNRAPFICTFCRTEFASYPELAEHLIVDEKAGLCTHCHRLFSSKALLDQHSLSAHKDEPEPATALQEYLTKPIEIGTSEVCNESGNSSDNKLVIQEDQVTGTAFHLVPTKVRTKVIHSDPSSSVVTQISTRPVIQAPAQHLISPREQVEEVQKIQSTNVESLPTLQWMDEEGNVMDVVIPFMDENEEVHELMGVVEVIETGPGAEDEGGTMTIIPQEAAGEFSYGTMSEQEVETARTLMLVNDPNREYAK